MVKLWITSLLLIGLSSCAAKLPYERKVTTKGLGEELDANAIFFTEISSGEQINLATYLEQSEREYALLMFSSRGCGVCTSKMHEIVQDVRPEHQAFTLQGRNNFELIGVNVDGPQSLNLVQRESVRQGFDFLKWNDAGATNMQEYFLPKGAKLSVPLTVLVSKDAIVWRLESDEKLTTREIFDKVMTTIAAGGQVTTDPDVQPAPVPMPTPRPRPDPGEGPDPTPQPLPPGKLSERLKGIDLAACQTGDVTDLEELFDRKDLRFLQVAPLGCDATCQFNKAQLASLQEDCLADGVGDFRGCEVVTAVAAEDPSSCAADLFAGGQPIIERFSSHFDWAHEAVLDEETWQVSLKPFAEPIVMAFDAEGRLVWSHEGKIAQAAELKQTITGGGFGDVPQGPNFLLMEPSVGNIGFSDIRRQAEFTVMFAFGELCSSCQAKLKKWSQPAGLLEYCQQSGGACQLIGVETGEPWSGTWAEHHAQVMQTLADYEVRVPIYVNPVSADGNDPDGLKRLFQGYLAGKMTNWVDDFGGLAYGVIIYSRDGLIVDEFVSSVELETNPYVFDRVKELVNGLSEGEDQ